MNFFVLGACLVIVLVGLYRVESSESWKTFTSGLALMAAGYIIVALWASHSSHVFHDSCDAAGGRAVNGSCLVGDFREVPL